MEVKDKHQGNNYHASANAIAMNDSNALAGLIGAALIGDSSALRGYLETRAGGTRFNRDQNLVDDFINLSQMRRMREESNAARMHGSGSGSNSGDGVNAISAPYDPFAGSLNKFLSHTNHSISLSTTYRDTSQFLTT